MNLYSARGRALRLLLQLYHSAALPARLAVCTPTTPIPSAPRRADYVSSWPGGRAHWAFYPTTFWCLLSLYRQALLPHCRLLSPLALNLSFFSSFLQSANLSPSLFCTPPAHLTYFLSSELLFCFTIYPGLTRPYSLLSSLPFLLIRFTETINVL